MPRQPDFICVGAQKCASTWIHRILESHPNVSVSDPKELDFFSSRFDRGFGWYENHFTEGEALLAAGETSPSYFCNPLAVERARTYNQHFKIIVTLRDPIDRMYSNHLHEVRKGHISGGDVTFETAMLKNPMYLHQSLYARHLEMWIGAFGLNNMLILFQENIAEDPLRAAANLCDFLGIPDEFESEFFHRRANENVTYKSPAIGAVYARLGGAARAAGLSNAINWAKQTGGISLLWSAAKKNLSADIAPMKPETVDALRMVLAPEMRALIDLLKIDALPWPNWRAICAEAA